MRSRFYLLVVMAVILLGIPGWYVLQRPDRTSSHIPAGPLLNPDSEVGQSQKDHTPATIMAGTVELPLAPPVPTTGRVWGRIYGSDGIPSTSTEVTVSCRTKQAGNTDAGYTFHSTSDQNGNFEFTGLPLGRCTVNALSGDEWGEDRCFLTRQAPQAEVSIVLSLAIPLGGTVVGPRGEPVPHGVLYPLLWNSKTSNTGSWSGSTTQTGDIGDFLFPSLEPGVWSVYVVAQGFAPTLSPPLEAGQLDALIRLKDGVTVAGIVLLKSSNEPAAGVLVSLSDASVPGPTLSARNDSDGAFYFEALARGSYQLRVQQTDAGYALEKEPYLLNVEDTPIDNLTLYVQPGGVVKGRIISGQSGEGVASVEIDVLRRDRGPSPCTTVTSDATGRYIVTGLSSGEYVVRPGSQRGYADSKPATANVGVRVGTTVVGVDFTFSAGNAIRGRVFNKAGEAQPGARVLCRDCASLRPFFSDAMGDYALTDVKAGQDVNLSAFTATMESEPVGPVHIPEGGVDGVDLILSRDRNSVLVGTLIDERGRTLAGTISAQAEGDTSPFTRGVTSRSDGHFVITGLSAGEYTLSAQCGHGLRQELRSLTLKAGQRLDGIRLVYQIGRVITIAGRVVNVDEIGVEGSVNLMRQDGDGLRSQSVERTALDGYFEFKNVPDGAYGVIGSATGYGTAEISNISGDTADIVLVLPLRPHISGHVVDEQGKPVTNFEIAALPYGTSAERMDIANSVYDSEGAFLLEVEENAYSLLTRANGYATVKTRVGMVESDRPVENILVTLQASGLWRGRVLNAAGQAVSGAAVFIGEIPLQIKPYQDGVMTISGPDGVFEIPAMDSGQVSSISAYHNDFGVGVSQVSDPGKTQVPDILLYPTGSLQVSVTYGDQPATEVYVVATRGGSNCTARTSVDGICRFEQLSEGEVSIEIVDPAVSQTLGRESAEIVSGTETQISISL